MFRRIAPVLVVLSTFATVCSAESETPEWRIFLEWLRDEQQELTTNLKSVRESLEQRAQLEGGDALERLRPKPPEPRPSGYGILPTIVENEAIEPVPLTAQHYSLEGLAREYTAVFRDASLLLRKTKAGSPPLLQSTDELLSLERHAVRLDEHLGYHETWQQAVMDYPGFFAGRNRLHSQMLEHLDLLDQAAVARNEERHEQGAALEAQAAERRRNVSDAVAPFVTTPGLRVEDGVLAVPIHTDIEDESFLAAFIEAVETSLRRPTVREVEAPSEAGSVFHSGSQSNSDLESVSVTIPTVEGVPPLKVEVELHRVKTRDLYAEAELPYHGDSINTKAHVEKFIQRFGPSTLVLSTGAHRTVAEIGRSIILGPENRSPRSLAHEFCHLLGFADAYLRAFEGDPNDPAGCTLVEWTGLQNNIMGSPSRGTWTVAMEQTVATHYGQGPKRSGHND